MNPQFSSPRQSNLPPPLPFFNPQKDTVNSSNPNHFHANSNNPNSKSYITRSITSPQQNKNGNSSTYIKSATDSIGSSSKFIPGQVTMNSNSSTYSTSANNFNTFSNIQKNTEMVKSSFHDQVKPIQTNFPFNPADKSNYVINSPTKRERAPRYSEPNIAPPQVSMKPAFNEGKSAFTMFPTEKHKEKDSQNKEDIHFFKQKSTPPSFPLQKKEDKLKFESPIMFKGAHQKDTWLTTSLRVKKARQITVNDFQKIKELGSGKYGQVYLARQKHTGFMCALKVLQKRLLIEQQIVDQFIRQLKIQMYLHHPNIIKLYGYFDDQQCIYIILECGTGGQLYHQLRKSQPMAEPKAAGILKQVCEAVTQLHSMRIIHRDIKPENIVLHDNVVKLCDFGWSVHQDNQMRTTFCGTPLYVCPQILKGNVYDEKIDIWSLGIMMYEMLVGENPFKISKEEELIKIVKEEIAIPSYVFVSREARDFLDKCLKKNPNDRSNIKELLNHQFFIKNIEKQDKKIVL